MIFEFKANQTSMWVKIIAGWATALLYMWTLVAPRVCGQVEYAD